MDDLPEYAAGSFGSFFDDIENGYPAGGSGAYSIVGTDNNSSASHVPSIRKRARFSMGECRNVGEVYTFSGDFGWKDRSSANALSEVYIRIGVGNSLGGFYYITTGTVSGQSQNQYATKTASYTTTRQDVGKQLEFWIEWIDGNDYAGQVTIRSDKLKFEVTRKRPLWGVIRWDGYNGSDRTTQKQEIGAIEDDSAILWPCASPPACPDYSGFLFPVEWNWRAPFYATVTGNPSSPIELNPDYGTGSTSGSAESDEFIEDYVLDEIDYAAGAGIDYWAIVHYPAYSPLNLRDALEVIVDPGSPTNVKFALMVSGSQFQYFDDGVVNAKMDEWEDAYVPDLVSLMKHANYQKVMNSRPLVFIDSAKTLSETLGDPVDGSEGQVTNLQAAIEYLRSEARSEGLKNPYVVSMAYWGAKFVDNAGADAISIYLPGVGLSANQTAPYSDLWANLYADIWNYAPTAGAWTRKVVPNMPSSLDASPRTAVLGAASGNYDLPLEHEGYDVFKNTMDLANTNLNNKYEANTVITYAWNEFSEGGFLCPIAGDVATYDPAEDEPDTSFLDKYSSAVLSWISPDHDSDLVLHLSLDNNAADTSGEGNSGTVVGATFAGQAPYGSHLADFDGSGDYITVADDASLEGMSAVTVSAWVRLDSLPNTHFAPVAKNNSYRIVVGSDGSVQFAVQTVNNGWYSTGTYATYPAGLEAGKWHHLVGSYDGSRVGVWLDGKGAVTSTAISGNIATSGTIDLTIGRGTSPNVDDMPGLVDEVRVYDKAVYWQ